MFASTMILLAAWAAEPAPRLADVAWLAANWRGTMGGGSIEEVWTAAQGGVMIGMFRMVNAKGQAVFYEFQVIEETAEGVRLKIKHFNRALKGEEAPEDFTQFRLTQASASEAHFESDEEKALVKLEYRRLPGDRLEIDFRKTTKSTGKEQRMRFPFEKVR